MASYFDPGGGMDRENAAIRSRNAARYQAAASRQRFLQQAALIKMSRTAAPAAAPTTGGGLTAAAKSAYGKAIDQYAPGGGFMKGIEAGLGRGRTKAVASGMSGLVGAGMANTTQAAGLGKRYEEEVGAPTRAGAETTRTQALASLYARLGGAEQGAFEGGANRQTSLTQTAMSNMSQIPQVQMFNPPAPQNTYTRSMPMGSRGGISSGGGYQSLLPGKSYFS